mmetsp:Transcript_13881/g.20543  ORF Transcript_13881/g.20543 Transcript_13881/m.20543 type:complete len:105 (-) Transcript_13881:117-431(-)
MKIQQLRMTMQKMSNDMFKKREYMTLAKLDVTFFSLENVSHRHMIYNIPQTLHCDTRSPPPPKKKTNTYATKRGDIRYTSFLCLWSPPFLPFLFPFSLLKKKLT